MPKGWEWSTLGEVCSKVVDGDHNPPPSEPTPTEYLMISSKNVLDGHLDELKEVRYLSRSVFEECNKRIRLMRGDLLLTTVGTLGRSCIYDGNKKIVLQRSVSVLTPLVSSEYVKCFLDSGYFQRHIDNNARGTAQKGFYLNLLEATILPIPPLHEQRRIVAKTSSLLSELNRIDNENCELQDRISQAKSRILDLAIHGKLVPQNPSDEPAIELLKRINPHFIPSDNLHYAASVPDGWQLCHIQDIASVELGKTLDRLKNYGEEKPYLCALNVKWDSFDLSTVKTIRIASSEKERYAVKPGDLLVCEGGDVGRSAIWTEHIEMYYQNALHRIRFKSQDICQEFFLYVLRNYKDRGIIDDVCKGVTIKHFTGQVFKSLDLPIPPLKEQKRIVDCVNAYCNILEEIAAGIK